MTVAPTQIAQTHVPHKILTKEREAFQKLLSRVSEQSVDPENLQFGYGT